MTGAAGRRQIRFRSCLFFYLLFAGLLIATHATLLRLPYFWDEAGQFIPASLDLLHGAWIPYTTVPNIHPPGVPAYLAGAWRVAGFHPETTRVAMLLLAGGGMLAAFLLAIELLRPVGASGAPALLAAAMLCVSPIFFAQSMLAQLDAPAMLFTTGALLLFVQDRLALSAAACVALVLVKETGAVVPVVFALWLARERRWREAAYFLLPLAAVGGWVAALRRATGHWAGNDDFASYNVWYPLHPARLTATLARRIYFLFGSSFHWIGTIALIWAWRNTTVFRNRAWKVAAAVVAAHVLLFTALGGAVLNRYLLPILPVLFAAFAAALAAAPRIPRRIGATALIGGLAASNYINPLYPFPFEENLAFVDFIRLHQDAADYLAHRRPDLVVRTAWPMSAELSNPQLGFSPRKIRVETLPDMATSTLGRIDWKTAQIVVVFSRKWDPRANVARMLPFARRWEGIYDFVPNATRAEAREIIPFPVDASFERRGQWVEIYVNPGVGGRGPGTGDDVARAASRLRLRSLEKDGPAPDGAVWAGRGRGRGE